MSKIREHQDELGQDGMDLRDTFAAKAMQVRMETSTTSYYDDIAKFAYLMADAMMKAREQ